MSQQLGLLVVARCVCGQSECANMRTHERAARGIMADNGAADDLARSFARRQGWVFTGWRAARDLFGVTCAVACFLDGVRVVERTLDVLR